MFAVTESDWSLASQSYAGDIVHITATISVVFKKKGSIGMEDRASALGGNVRLPRHPPSLSYIPSLPLLFHPSFRP